MEESDMLSCHSIFDPQQSLKSKGERLNWTLCQRHLRFAQAGLLD